MKETGIIFKTNLNSMDEAYELAKKLNEQNNTDRYIAANLYDKGFGIILADKSPFRHN